MKQILVFFLMVFVSLNPVFPGDEINNPGKTFMLHENASIYLSFEHYKMKDGWTPVVLSVGEVDCLLWMDAFGRVSEWREIQDNAIAPLGFIDPLNQTLGKGADLLYFDVYEQNPVRSRWRLSPYGTPGQLTKRIRFHKHGIDFYIGSLWLPLRHVSCDFREVSPGLFRVQLIGIMPARHPRLIYEKAAGIIYSTPVGDTTLIPRQSRTWARRREETGKQTIGGK